MRKIILGLSILFVLINLLHAQNGDLQPEKYLTFKEVIKSEKSVLLKYAQGKAKVIGKLDPNEDKEKEYWVFQDPDSIGVVAFILPKVKQEFQKFLKPGKEVVLSIVVVQYRKDSSGYIILGGAVLIEEFVPNKKK